MANSIKITQNKLQYTLSTLYTNYTLYNVQCMYIHAQGIKLIVLYYYGINVKTLYGSKFEYLSLASFCLLYTEYCICFVTRT